MPLYLAKTGRSRRLKASGTFSYSHDVVYQAGLPGVPFTAIDGAVKIVGGWSPTNPPYVSSAPTGKLEGTILGVCDGFNSPISLDNTFAQPGAPPWNFSNNVTGSYEIHMDVEEWVEIGLLSDIAPSDCTVINGTSFPSFGGTGEADGIPAVYCLFYELGKAGGTSYATITDSYGTLSSTYTLAGGESPGYIFTYEENLSTSSYPSGGSSSVNISEATLGGLISPPYNQSETGADGTVTAYADGTTFTVSATWPSNGGCVCDMAFAVSPPVTYGLDLRARCDADAAPMTVPVRVQDVRTLGGGTWNIASEVYNLTPTNVSTVNQQTVDVTGQYNVGSGVLTMPSLVIAEIEPIRMWLDSTFFGPDDSRDWRCQIRGMGYEFGTLVQAPSLSVCAGGSIAATSGSLTPTVNDWEGYRYLQFTADQNGTLTIGAKHWSWTVTTPGTAQTITLDLCSPTGWTNNGGVLLPYDGRLSRFPLITPASTATGNYPDETTPDDHHKGQMWGVLTDVTSLAFSGIPSSSTLHVGTMSLIRQSYAHASFLPKFLSDMPGWTDSSSDVWTIAPFGLLESDGKLCGDWPAIEYSTPHGGSTVMQYETLSSFGSMLGYIPGWTFTPYGGSYPDSWHDASAWAAWAMGGGAYKIGSGSWVDAMDLDATSTITLYAQELLDQVQAYPGCGDCWEVGGTGAYNVATPIRMSKTVRGAAQGLAFKSDGTPYNAAAVTAYETSAPSISWGSATADSIGAYKTGSTYGYGDVDGTTELHMPPMPYVTDHGVWSNRQRRRDSFRKSGGVKTLSYDVSPFLRHAVAWSDNSSGHLWLGFSSNSAPAVLTQIDTGISASQVCIQWQKLGASSRLGMAYPDGSGNLLLVTTPDEGNTFSMPITITSSLPTSAGFAYVEDRSGLKHFYWEEGTGPCTVWYGSIDSQGNVVKAPTATNITDADLGSLASARSVVDDGEWRLGVTYTVSGALTLVQSTGGDFTNLS